MSYNIEVAAREFLDTVLPSDVPPMQRDEMSKAFMAGFAEATHYHHDIIPSMDDDAAELALVNIHHQLAEYAASLGGQRADRPAAEPKAHSKGDIGDV